MLYRPLSKVFPLKCNTYIYTSQFSFQYYHNVDIIIFYNNTAPIYIIISLKEFVEMMRCKSLAKGLPDPLIVPVRYVDCDSSKEKPGLC